MEQIWPVLALIAGIASHITKKAAKLRLQDETFRLGDYLMGHPFQTFSTLFAAGGAYLVLWENSPDNIVIASAAYLAGIAANSVGDLAPGQR